MSKSEAWDWSCIRENAKRVINEGEGGRSFRHASQRSALIDGVWSQERAEGWVSTHFKNLSLKGREKKSKTDDKADT